MPFFVIKKGLVLLEWKYFPTPKILDPLIHVLYAVHYSEMYYRRNAHFSDGGINFNSKEAPDIWDFAYLSYTIGMTYQVSDTTFLTTDFRKLALSHTLISFLFSTVLIATMINFIASLMS